MSQEPTTEELERAGIPTRRTTLLKVLGTVVGVALFGYVFVYRMFVASPIYANKIARIDVAGWDSPATASVQAHGKRKLFFVLTADEYTYSGGNRIYLKAEGLRAGQVVVTVDCMAKRLKDVAWGNQGGSSAHYDECDMALPPEGVDAMRVTLRRSNPGNRLDVARQRVEIAAE